MKLLPLILLFPLCVAAQVTYYTQLSPPVTKFNAATSVSYLYQQDFESGVNSAPTGWAVGTGTVTWNYATAPAPLAGSYSIGIAASSDATLTLSTVGISGITSLYYYFVFNAANGNDQLVSFVDSSGDGFGLDQSSSSGNISLRVRAPGGTSQQTTSTYTAATTIHVWIAVKIAGGSTSSLECWWSTTPTKPSTGGNNYAISNNGTTSGTFTTFIFGGGSTAGLEIYDTLRIASSPIGSNPL